MGYVKEPPPRFQWHLVSKDIALFFATIAVMSPIAAYRLLHHWSTGSAAVAAAWFVIQGLCITLGYHRGGTHKAFEMPRWLWGTILVVSTGSIMLPFLTWKSRHQSHHQHPEDPVLDPYPMYPGFWGFLYTHVGCVVMSRYKDPPDMVAKERDPLVLLQYRLYWPLAAAFAFLVPTALGSMVGNTLTSFLLCFPTLGLLYNGAWFVNSAAHSLGFGDKPLGQESSAVEIRWWPWGFLPALLSLGEALGHEAHHKYPAAAITGARGNISDMALRLLSWLGLARKLRPMPEGGNRRRQLV